MKLSKFGIDLSEYKYVIFIFTICQHLLVVYILNILFELLLSLQIFILIYTGFIFFIIIITKFTVIIFRKIHIIDFNDFKMYIVKDNILNNFYLYTIYSDIL